MSGSSHFVAANHSNIDPANLQFPRPEKTRIQTQCEPEPNWLEVWDSYQQATWFCKCLDFYSTQTLWKARLPQEWSDDVKQQASLIFGQCLKRNVSLGFDNEKGAVKPFLALIIQRCCLKSLRQFKGHAVTVHCSEVLACVPNPESTMSVDEALDLRDCVKELSEPHFSTIQLFLQGNLIEDIASQIGTSPRTVYRHIATAVAQMQTRMFQDELP